MRFTASFLLLIATIGLVNKNEAKTAENKTANGQQQTQERTIPQEINITVSEPHTKDKQPDPYDAEKDYLYRAYLVFTILGVCATVVGIIAIYRQTKATKDAAIATAQSAEASARSAKATEDSVRLQEISLKQWVNIGDWKASMDKKNWRLNISFHVINPTKIPVTLHAVVVKFKAGQDIQRQDTGVADVLPPDNPFIADISVVLTKEEIEEYIDSKPIFISVECSVLFADCRREHWEQIFKRMVLVDKAVVDAKHPPTVMEVRNILRKSAPPSQPAD
jgi:hypothetical protein